MGEIAFTTMTDEAAAPEVLAMMRALYVEDHPASPTDASRFPLTIRHLVRNPVHGRIVLFRDAEAVLGYAILVPYWSNEFGGTLLFVDELYVVAEARGRGIGHQFFSFLDRERPFDPVALALEVSPKNERARRLYEALGFRARANTTLVYPLPHTR